MRRQLQRVVGVCVLFVLSVGGGVAGTFEVVRSIPYPMGAGTIFIQDLAWDGSYLWTSGINIIWPMGGDGQAVKQGMFTYRVNPYTGAVNRWFTSEEVPSKWGHTWDGTHLWTTSPQGWTDPSDPKPDYLYKLDTSGNLIDTVLAPYSPDAFPTGAAWDGSALWISDRHLQKISRVDPEDGTVLESFDSPGEWQPRGLTWADGSLWSVGGPAYGAIIYELDPSGNLLEEWPVPAGVHPRGLTFDGSSFWVADESVQRLYRLRAVIPEPSSLVILLMTGASVLAILCCRTVQSPGAMRIRDYGSTERRNGRFAD